MTDNYQFDLNLINAIKNSLTSREETLSVAESVTAGLLQLAFSQADNATLFFQGGITVYNLGQKARQLNIEPIHAIACNCVSDKIASQMALESCKLFSSNWGIGVTGYAAPVPELKISELYAYIAIAHNGEIKITERITTNEKSHLSAQVDYVKMIVSRLDNFLKKTIQSK